MKLAFFDLDGVFYDGHLMFDCLRDQEEKGLIAGGTWKRINNILENYKEGKINYKSTTDSVLRIYAEALMGQKYRDLVSYTRKLIREHQNKFLPYFPKVASFLSETHYIYLVTNNFDFACSAVVEYFGLKGQISSIIGQKGGIVTGNVDFSIGGNKGIVAGLIKKYGWGGSIAVGDSENDADMLEKVEFPLAMEPNAKLKTRANEKNWQIVTRYTITGIIESYVRRDLLSEK